MDAKRKSDGSATTRRRVDPTKRAAFKAARMIGVIMTARCRLERLPRITAPAIASGSEIHSKNQPAM